MRALVIFFLIFASVPAFSATHSCTITTTVQVYDSTTFALLRHETVQSEKIVVTDEPHQEPQAFSLYGAKGLIGTGTVMTGTLLGTNEGDVIQAQANFSLLDVDGTASLVMSIDSPMAKAITVLEKVMPEELYLMPVDLKCSLI